MAATYPIVIGGTGGSGTRLIAQMLMAAGVDLGRSVNGSLDALAFVPLYDIYVDAYLRGESIDRSGFEEHLAASIRSHRGDRHAYPWGWKNPRSLFILSLLDDSLPDLRFIHVIRHGLDMATSRNQNQLHLHGEALLGDDANCVPQAIASALLWQRANTNAADYGEQNMPGRYWRVRYEDVCRDPTQALAPVLDGLALAPPRNGWPRVQPSPARWRNMDPALRDRLAEAIGGTMNRFGYTVSDAGLAG